MPHDIIDNAQTKLLDVMQTILTNSKSAKFAVGYFFLSGLEAVADQLSEIHELRLLIGNTTNRETIEQLAEGCRRLNEVQQHLQSQLYPKNVEMKTWTADTATNIGLDAAAMTQSDQSQKLIGTLTRLVAEGRLKVRVYNKGRLHAKAYIFDYKPGLDQPGVGIVGSSNFTLGGLTHNSELNVKIYGHGNHSELTRWFERLWDEAQEFEEFFMQELQQSWALAQTTPYEVYLKALYEFVKDRLDDETSREFLWQTEITAALTEFQKNAVRRAIQIIRQYNGAFVSDVVGLGKSYIGSAILKHFERHDRSRSLIICPASLVRMWERYNEQYQLNARVLSMGMLREDRENPDFNILMDDELYTDRDFVLVDESHNFRSSDIQRYRILQTFLQSGDRRCVFLTATPQNRDVWDIYNQLRLFQASDRTLIPIEPPHLRDFIKLVEHGKQKIASLLSNIMVRRTRVDVLRWYGYDSKTDEKVDPFDFDAYRKGEKLAYIKVKESKQFFPKRHLETISYNIDNAYRGLYQRLLDLIGKPGASPQECEGGMKYARYGLWHYVKEEKRNKSPYNDLQRAGINLRGLMRISLFKRFESSVAAFRATLQRLITSHSAFLQALEEGVVPAGEEASDILIEADKYDERALVDELAKVSRKYELEDFDSDKLKQDIQSDLRVLREMYALVDPITPATDDKLQTLKNWLHGHESDVGPLADEKCLIFTQYADTAKYLFENLNPQDKPEIEVIYGSAKEKYLVAGRFSPIANPADKPKSKFTEIELLIATDVMSEGLNLQDSDRVINYDLHWNPLRLIQRFGRIDRIGTKHEHIYGFNFLPEIELEKGLGLLERLKRRIEEINRTLGGDAAILDPSERLNPEAFIAIYQGKSIDQFEEEDDTTLVDLIEAEEFIRQLREDDPELFKHILGLRDGIRSAKLADQAGNIVVCRYGNYRKIYLTGSKGNITNQDMPSNLATMQCEKDTPRESIPKGYNAQVSRIFEKFSQDAENFAAQQKMPVTLSLAQRYILREFDQLYSQTEDQDLLSQIGLYTEVFKLPQTKAVRTELNTLRRESIVGIALFEQLARIYDRHGLANRSINNNQEVGEEKPYPQIVCSLALIAK